MKTPTPTEHLKIERFRDYLLVLARLQMATRPGMKLDASDVVQNTLVRACERQDQFRGTTPHEMAGWLRSILANTIATAMRDQRRQKRDARREASFQADLDHSSARLEKLLISSRSSPSHRAELHDDILRLSRALCALDDRPRTALLLRYCHECKLIEIADHMECGITTVSDMIRSGLRQVRESLGD